MKAVFRVDASIEIGAGHVMRCLTLAEALREARVEVAFLSKEVPGHALELILGRGFPARFVAGDAPENVVRALAALGLKEPVDWLVADHYALDARWEGPLRRAFHGIAVIDDLANRAHDCDVLLDQNYYVDADRRYRERVPGSCTLFLGPRFALLRKEFYEAARRPRPRNGDVRRILLSFGATDPSNETGKALSALRSLEHGADIDVVIGATNPGKAEIARDCEAIPRCRCFVQTSQMAELMSVADLAIGAGGVTTWERCRLGLPAITVAIAENQVRTTTDLAEAGVTWYLGRASELGETDYRDAIEEALRSPERLKAMTAAAERIMGPVPSGGSHVHPLARHMLENSTTKR